MDDENKKRIQVDVDLGQIRQYLHTNFKMLSFGLDVIVMEIVDQMNLEPANRKRLAEILLAKAMIIHSDAAASVAKEAQKVLADVDEIKRELH